MDHKTLIDRVSKTANIPKAEVNELMVSFTEVVEEALASGDSISIPSFGNFEPRKRNERIMSHPSVPGKRLLVPPKVVVNFKPSTILKSKLKEQ